MFGRVSRERKIDTVLKLASKVKPNPTRDVLSAKKSGAIGLMMSKVLEYYCDDNNGGARKVEEYENGKFEDLMRAIMIHDVKQSYAMCRLSTMYVGKQRIVSKIWEEYNKIVDQKRQEAQDFKTKGADDEFEDNVDMDHEFLSFMQNMFKKDSNIWNVVKDGYMQRIGGLFKDFLSLEKIQSASVPLVEDIAKKVSKKPRPTGKVTLRDMVMSKLKRPPSSARGGPPLKKQRRHTAQDSLKEEKDLFEKTIQKSLKRRAQEAISWSGEQLKKRKLSQPLKERFEAKKQLKRRATTSLVREDGEIKKRKLSHHSVAHSYRSRRGNNNARYRCEFEGILQHLVQFVYQELSFTDIKREVSNLRNEVLTMDVESGRINTNRLTGDERFDAMLFCLDVFEWSREDTQVEIHDEMMLVLLPVIYGDEWIQNYEHIMTRYDVLKYMPELIIICARRWGKTIGCAMMSATLLLFVPSLVSIVFSTGQRTSTKFMQESVKLLLQSPFMATCKIMKNGDEVLTIKHFGNERRMEALCARLEVFFIWLLVCCIFCLFLLARRSRQLFADGIYNITLRVCGNNASSILWMICILQDDDKVI